MHIEIRRHTLAADGTFGDLYVDGDLLGHTCERTDVQLPAGDYQLLPHESNKECLAKWKGLTVSFHNPALNVYAEQSMIPPGVHGSRFDCLIHPANWPDELLGCVAPGIEVEQIPPHGWGVSGSRSVFDLLVRRWGDRNGLTATITESYA